MGNIIPPLTDPYTEPTMTPRLRYPAPRRASSRTEAGWTTHPYTKEEIDATIASGGWFESGKHDFAERSTKPSVVSAAALLDELTS